MPKITFHEFRPGKWVKLIDGKVVGPATAAEVAAWKQEKAAPARIWEDVVASASRPPLDEARAGKSPTVPSEAPAEAGARKEPDQSILWEDLVKRTKPSVRAEGPPQPQPRQADTDRAEQGQIWQAVMKRAKEPERQPAQAAPILPQPGPEVKPKPPTGASLAPTATPTKPTPPTAVTKAQPESQSAERAFAAEVVPPRLAAVAHKPTATAEPEARASSVKEAPEASPAPEPTPLARVAGKAESEPARRPAPVQKMSPEKRPPAPKTLVTQAMFQKPAPRSAQKTRTRVKVVPARERAALTTRAKPAAEDRLPATLLDESKEESAPAAEPVKRPAARAERRQVPPSLGRESAGRKHKSSPTAASRRSTGKGKTAPAQERPNQMYLWISVGQADDLVAAVRTGLARYQERFSHAAEVVLCHGADLPALEGAKLSVDLREGKSLAPRNFWIGSK